MQNIVLVVLFLAAALPSRALTNISACGSYAANDTYVVTADISSSSTTVACLSFAGISNTANGVYIDLNGHNVVSTAYHALDIFNCVANVYLHDSVGTGSFRGKVGYGGTGPSVVSAIEVQNSATAASAWILIAGIKAYGEIRVDSTDKTTYPMKNLHAEYTRIINGDLAIVRVDNAYVTGLTIDNRYDTTIWPAAGLVFLDCVNQYVEYSTVIGGPGSNSASSTLNTDDGVLFSCSGTGTCSGGTTDHVTAYDLYDAGWEGTGHLSGVTVSNNVFYRPAFAGMGGYAPYRFSLSSSVIANNKITGVSTSTYLLAFSGTIGDPTPPDFSNNTITGNTIDVSASSFISGTFSTYANNSYSNNRFGSSAVVVFQSLSGATDGGGNVCGSTSPSSASFVCH